METKQPISLKFYYTNEEEFRAAEKYLNGFGYYFFGGTCAYPGRYSTIGVEHEDKYLYYNLINPEGAIPAAWLLPTGVFKALKNVL